MRNDARPSRRPSAPSAARCAERLAAAALAALAALAAPLPAGPAAAADEAPAGGEKMLDGIVAVIDGDPISLRELKQYGARGAAFLPAEVRHDYRALLDSMIERRLLRAACDKNGIQAPDAMVDRYIAGVLEDTGQTRATLDAEIARAGLTWKDYFERMREEVQRIQLVNLEIRSRVNVPEEEVRRVWEEDPAFLQDETLEVAVILVPADADRAKARAKADEVRKEALGDFEDAAEEHSVGPAASEGGNLGRFKRGTLKQPIEKALDGLDEGEVSQPVEAAEGFYIVKLVKVHSGGRRPYDEVKESLSEKLYQKRLDERYRKWSEEDLRKGHHVEILVERLALIAAGAPAPAPDAAPAVPGVAPLAPEDLGEGRR